MPGITTPDHDGSLDRLVDVSLTGLVVGWFLTLALWLAVLITTAWALDREAAETDRLLAPIRDAVVLER